MLQPWTLLNACQQIIPAFVLVATRCLLTSKACLCAGDTAPVWRVQLGIGRVCLVSLKSTDRACCSLQGCLTVQGPQVAILAMSILSWVCSCLQVQCCQGTHTNSNCQVPFKAMRSKGAAKCKYTATGFGQPCTTFVTCSWMLICSQQGSSTARPCIPAALHARHKPCHHCQRL